MQNFIPKNCVGILAESQDCELRSHLFHFLELLWILFDAYKTEMMSNPAE